MDLISPDQIAERLGVSFDIKAIRDHYKAVVAIKEPVMQPGAKGEKLWGGWSVHSSKHQSLRTCCFQPLSLFIATMPERGCGLHQPHIASRSGVTSTSVSPGGVYTLFMTGPFKEMWGFNVNGVKVPFRQYIKPGRPK